jgi:hypothetical protein
MHEGLKPKFEAQNGPLPLPYRVYRGRSWFNSAVHARAADRDGSSPGSRGAFLGLRLCRDVSYPDPKPSLRSDHAQEG